MCKLRDHDSTGQDWREREQSAGQPFNLFMRHCHQQGDVEEQLPRVVRGCTVCLGGMLDTSFPHRIIFIPSKKNWGKKGEEKAGKEKQNKNKNKHAHMSAKRHNTVGVHSSSTCRKVLFWVCFCLFVYIVPNNKDTPKRWISNHQRR